MGTGRLPVLKTYKLWIGGKFPRAESGRTLTACGAGGRHLAHYGQGSRKDVRDAVVAARAAVKAWSGSTPYLRGQILYRAAEMMESRAGALAEEVAASTGRRMAAARREVEAAVDCLVHYAGWADKIAQVGGSVNGVASPHFNFTVPEPTGVVGVLAPDEPGLHGFCGAVAPALAGGNCVVAVASERHPLPALSLAEALATSDFPAGTINILSGRRAELAATLATHRDVNAVVDAAGEAEVTRVLEEGVGTNLKRVSRQQALEEDFYRILETVELKTAWHPIGW